MDKTIKVVRYLFSIALVGCSVLSIVLFIHSNQVVAIAEAPSMTMCVEKGREAHGL